MDVNRNTTAVILAAGFGRRLRPLTNTVAKSMIPVDGRPILFRLIDQMRSLGVAKIVVVVGHLADDVVRAVRREFDDSSIEFVFNDQYSQTNNIFSLWLARQHLVGRCLLIEGDLLLKDSVFQRLQSLEGNWLAVSKCRSYMNGSCVELGPDEQITHFDVSSTRDAELPFKTMNVSLLSAELVLESLVPRLDEQIHLGNVNAFYESLFKDAMREDHAVFQGLVFDDSQWSEIDTVADLKDSATKFGPPATRLESLARMHGGLWRVGVQDHCYLQNPYFPSAALKRRLRDLIDDVASLYPPGHDVVSGYLSAYLGVPAHRLVVGNGSSGFIRAIGSRVCRGMAVPTPSFNEYEACAPPSKLMSFPLHPAEDFDLDLDRYARFVADRRPDVTVIVSPNNPTSRAVTRPELLQFLQQTARLDMMVVVDESFVDFTEDPFDQTLIPLVGKFPHLVVLRSLGKSHGVGGLRLGFVCSANVEYVHFFLQHTEIWNINSLAAEFLRLLPEHQNEFLSSCQNVRDDTFQLYQALLSQPGLEVLAPAANFLLCRSTETMAAELAARLLDEHNILIKVCDKKSMPDSDRYFRIASSSASNNQVLCQAMSAILSDSLAMV